MEEKRESRFMTVEEVAQELEVSTSYAYKVMRERKWPTWAAW